LIRNNPFKTVEEEILKVWLEMGLILPEHYEKPQTLYFQRAARTDKGVSAAKQILTCRLPEETLDRIDEMNKLLPTEIQVFGAKRTTKFFDSRTYCDARTYSYMLPTFALAKPDQLISTFYRVDQSLIDEFNRVLQTYRGTHNFHNFTSGKKPTDPSAMRFMMDISCGNAFMMQEMEFAIVRVKGQSFMLHQIRKMIGLAIAVMRGNANEATIEQAFQEEKLDIPIAPGLGLMLEEVHYDRYNLRYGGDGIHEPVVWPEVNDKIDEFKRKQILPNVYQGEKKEFSMIKWLQSLPIHTYGSRDQQKGSEEHQNQIKEAQLFTEKLIETERQAQLEQSTLAEKGDEQAVDQVTVETNSVESPVDPDVAYRKAFVNADLFAKKSEPIKPSDE
jgi:tRNA pseudouridine38-40 synthase